MAKKKRNKRGFASLWDLYLVYAFILIRILLNIEFEVLSLFFVLVHLILLLFLFKKEKWFTSFFVSWLVIDSMIGTFLATHFVMFDFMYWLTMAVNLFFIVLVIRNVNKVIPR